jgi:hypothetical protein
MWEPTQVGDHLGLTIDLLNGEFRAPVNKLQSLLQTSFSATRPSCDYRPLATGQTTSGIHAIPLPRHRAGPLFPSRTTLRTEYTTGMGRTRPNDAPAQARPRVVAYNARPRQRTLDLQTHRDSVPSRRHKLLRIGSRSERQSCLPSTRFLV